MKTVKPSDVHRQEQLVDIPAKGTSTLKACLFPGEKSRKHVCFVVAHPYGPLGGSMDNEVVHGLYIAFASMGYMALRFNFRGVAGSTGRTSFTGNGEIEDVMHVYRYLKGTKDSSPIKIVLCGYSYGSVATCAAASQIPETIALISISYPIGVLWALSLGNQQKRVQSIHSLPATVLKFFICGSKDNFTSEAAFNQFTATLAEPKTCVVVPDMDHFWRGGLDGLTGHINQWVSRVLRVHLGERTYSNVMTSTQSPPKMHLGSMASLVWASSDNLSPTSPKKSSQPLNDSPGRLNKLKTGSMNSLGSSNILKHARSRSDANILSSLDDADSNNDSPSMFASLPRIKGRMANIDSSPISTAMDQLKLQFIDDESSQVRRSDVSSASPRTSHSSPLRNHNEQLVSSPMKSHEELSPLKPHEVLSPLKADEEVSPSQSHEELQIPIPPLPPRRQPTTSSVSPDPPPLPTLKPHPPTDPPSTHAGVHVDVHFRGSSADGNAVVSEKRRSPLKGPREFSPSPKSNPTNTT